jgi:hypothetical protein
MTACLPLVGCAGFAAMPAADLSVSVMPRHTSARYSGDLTGLVGRSIKPDLFPPIL